MSFPPYKLRGHIVEPRRKADIHAIAERTREVLQLSNHTPVDLCSLLDRLSVHYGLDYDVLEDHEMPISHAEAMCVPERATIYMPVQSLRAAARNVPRMRFTLFHELGHFILNHSRSYARGGNMEPKRYVDSEWQADQFAVAITMPASLIVSQKMYTAAQLVTRFGVSYEAAEHRIRNLQEEGQLPAPFWPTHKGGRPSSHQQKEKP